MEIKRTIKISFLFLTWKIRISPVISQQYVKMNVFHRRAFSQTILELGPKLNTANINPNNSAIYSLVKLKDVAEALNAPEGTVACAPISGPSQFDQGISIWFSFILNSCSYLFYTLQLYIAIARIERLEEDQRLLAFSQNSLAISHKEQLIKNQSLEESNKKLELSQHALQVSNSRLSDTVCTLNKNVEVIGKIIHPFPKISFLFFLINRLFN